ncbi:hypothetical protein F4780DRAFT_789793 [Xylariomycetidae sp. FL0641]|nr:hypothetical protein F4780DRAFT_789793 [Xylariomycetidae sp. FL0641]
MAFIRPYQETDFDACADICIATLPPSLATPASTAALTPYIWTHPYTTLSPGTCHVLDDGRGRAVGYCVGCRDLHALLARYPRYVSGVLLASPACPVPTPPQLATREPWTLPPPSSSSPPRNHDKEQVNPLALAQLAHRGAYALLSLELPSEPAKRALAARYRATLHVDLLPAYRRCGWGRRLLRAFEASVLRSPSSSSDGDDDDDDEDFGAGVHVGINGAENAGVVGFYARCGFRVVAPPGGGEAEGAAWMVRDFAKGGEEGGEEGEGEKTGI